MPTPLKDADIPSLSLSSVEVHNRRQCLYDEVIPDIKLRPPTVDDMQIPGIRDDIDGKEELRCCVWKWDVVLSNLGSSYRVDETISAHEVKNCSSILTGDEPPTIVISKIASRDRVLPLGSQPRVMNGVNTLLVDCCHVF